MRLLHRIAFTPARSRFVIPMLLGLLGTVYGAAPARAQWTQPTPEELSMTSQPQAPGADAVYLYREEKVDDMLGQQSYYFRVKVLTEKGRALGDVQTFSASDADLETYSLSSGENITGIEGRTIHSDGTVIPFTGKPYTRIVEQKNGLKISETAFTLPDVQTGSILEYRYSRVTSNGGATLHEPTWFVQNDIYTRKAYFYWKVPDYADVFDNDTGESVLGISYTQTLPAGVTVQSQAIPAGGSEHAYHRYELTARDIPAIPKEEYMPPLRSSVYRVNFFYSFTRNQDQFWRDEGKALAKKSESFTGPANSMRSVVETLVIPADPQTVKLQKIYAAVQGLENTSFSRERDKAEDKAHNEGTAKNVQDVWQRKSGDKDQLALLFIALARSAGMTAYVMKVTNRDENLFTKTELTSKQLNDDVAIVAVDGKEQFFDPGQKECPFGQMAWKHTGTSGLREIADGSMIIAVTPEPPYTESQAKRVALLNLNADGTATGTLQITWTGAPALEWRQQYVTEDEIAVRLAMRKWMESNIPSGMKLNLSSIDNLSDYEKPLVATFKVEGPLASVTAKRLILPSQFFEVNSKPLFPEPTRDLQVYFNHTSHNTDAMQIDFPTELQVESAPKDNAFTLQKLASYHAVSQVKPGVVITQRSYVLGTAFFNTDEYGDVKTFYDKVAVADQEPVLLTIGAAPAAAAGTK